MSHRKQFTLYTNQYVPNGWYVAFPLDCTQGFTHCPTSRKVAVILEELGLTYHPIYLDWAKNEQKSPEHVELNPNGRIPTIIDHKNNDLVLWCAFVYSLLSRALIETTGNRAPSSHTSPKSTTPSTKYRRPPRQTSTSSSSGSSSRHPARARTSGNTTGSCGTTMRRCRAQSSVTKRRSTACSMSLTACWPSKSGL